jgi:hypothetical protein
MDVLSRMLWLLGHTTCGLIEVEISERTFESESFLHTEGQAETGD